MVSIGPASVSRTAGCVQRMDRIIHEAVLANRRRHGGRAACRKTLGEQCIGGKQRAVSVAGIVARRIQQIERVKLDAPAIRELIPDTAVDRIDRRRLKYAVLGERTRTDVAPAQGAEPAGSLAERDARRRDHPWRFRDQVTGRVADLRLREAGERIEEFLLSGVEADKARAAERQVGIEAHPRHRLIIVCDLDTGAKAGRTRHRGPGVTVEK